MQHRYVPTMFRAALALTIALLATAPPSQAETTADVGGVRFTYTDTPIPDDHARRGLATAAAYWGRLPNCTIQWRRIAVSAAGDAVAMFPPEVMAADQASCTIWAYRPWLASKRKAMVCTMIVHEVGHLLGYDHEPTGVMAPTLWRALPECKW